ncbi:hypothetical protein Vretimale_6324 [Volvox reticuliferus]|uniref:Uncharacterized protein n=1 Tax=Volvox reticuliferus TaxID=1737510 RepID=A0A8J4G7K3_9CHLO|nr:hypothetical protein Vretifemale_15996 [Volvox reticuliferus]GIM01534.1 hypothetical protein Vretimale_6324 [Volvox reticuliferus]
MAQHVKAWSPLLRRSAPPPMLIVLAFGLFALITFAPSSVAERDIIPKLACLDVPGYETIPEIYHFFPEGGIYPANTEMGLKGITADVRAACDANPSCLGFNTYGTSVNKDYFYRLSYNGGMNCQYIKTGSSKVYSGYTRRPYVSWISADDDTTFVDTESPEAAKRACDQNSACTAWNTAGQYAVGAVDTQNFEASSGGTTLYLKQVCPEKFGYTSYHGYQIKGASGDTGVGSGKLPGGATAAADFCRYDYRCTAYSTDGSYAVGGVDLVEVDANICTYVKDSCAPMRGFYVVNDVTLNEEPASRPDYKCFTEVYEACLNDPECAFFNNIRNIWGNNAQSLKIAPGMCLYQKLDNP